MSAIEKGIIEGLKEAKKFASGKSTKTKLHFVPDIKKIRKKFHMSQAKFAKVFHLSESNIRNWEQGRRVPDEAAKILLTVINKNPEAVIEALAGSA